MKSAVTTQPGRMEIRDTDVPRPAAGEALIQVDAVGLCGSDFHLYTGDHPYAHFPQVQGHEIIGSVLGYAPGGPSGPQIGARVAIEPFHPCGRCFACRRGRGNCCTDLKVMGAHAAGGLRERLTVPVARLHQLGDLPWRSAILVEPITIGLQCIVRADVQLGDDVLVIGAGPIGLAAALAAVDRGARVIVADRIADRLRRAERLGASAVVDTTTHDLAREVHSLTGGDGPAVVVEATGVPALINLGLEVVAHTGKVVIVGISDQSVAVPVGLFSRKEVDVLGSRNSNGLFPEAIALAGRHAERVAEMVTHTFPLERAPEAIDFASNNPAEVEKVVITMGDTQ